MLLLIRPCAENLVATATPRNIAHNCVFTVNLDRLPHQEDVKCDNLGSWRNNGAKNRKYEMNEEGYPELLDEEEAREATDTYSLRRVYLKNKAVPDLKKYVMSLKGKQIIIIFYEFENDERIIKTSFQTITNFYSQVLVQNHRYLNNNNNNNNKNNKWEEIIANRLFVHNAFGILLKQLNYQFPSRKCGIQHMLFPRGCVVVPFCCCSSFR